MERSRDLFVLYRGDVCLGCGTPEELEREFGLKAGSVRYHACPSACRKYGGKGLIAVKAGKERRDEEHYPARLLGYGSGYTPAAMPRQCGKTALACEQALRHMAKAISERPSVPADAVHLGLHEGWRSAWTGRI